MSYTTYKISGPTYLYRYDIKNSGGRWDPQQNAWFVNVGGGNGWDSIFWRWRRAGMKIEIVG